MVALLIAWYGVVEVPPAGLPLFEPDAPGDQLPEGSAQFRQLSEELRQLSEGALPPPAAGGCQGFPSRVTRGRGNFITRPGWDETTQTAWADRDEDRWKAILLAISVMLYMFLGLAIVCDEYFEAALEAICEAQNLKDDVAGATWMAAGGSAPELSTSVVGVFISQSDVGLGTIIGSAVFNVLFVIACCAFVAPNLHLHWYPLARDASYAASRSSSSSPSSTTSASTGGRRSCCCCSTLCARLGGSNPRPWPIKNPHAPLAAHHSPPASRPRYVTIMYKNDKLEAFVQRRIAAAKKPRSPMQAMIIDMFKRHWMNAVYSVIVVNVVVVLMMLTPSIEIDLVLMQNLEIINYTCSVIFILEMLVKFYAYGFFGYWREPLNCFDGVLVFLIFIETFLSFAPLVGGLNDDADGAFVGGFAGSARSARSASCAPSACCGSTAPSTSTIRTRRRRSSPPTTPRWSTAPPPPAARRRPSRARRCPSSDRNRSARTPLPPSAPARRPSRRPRRCRRRCRRGRRRWGRSRRTRTMTTTTTTTSRRRSSRCPTAGGPNSSSS